MYIYINSNIGVHPVKNVDEIIIKLTNEPEREASLHKHWKGIIIMRGEVDKSAKVR